MRTSFGTWVALAGALGGFAASACTSSGNPAPSAEDGGSSGSSSGSSSSSSGGSSSSGASEGGTTSSSSSSSSGSSSGSSSSGSCQPDPSEVASSCAQLAGACVIPNATQDNIACDEWYGPLLAGGSSPCQNGQTWNPGKRCTDVVSGLQMTGNCQLVPVPNEECELEYALSSACFTCTQCNAGSGTTCVQTPP